jgi:hypothetical protein
MSPADRARERFAAACWEAREIRLRLGEGSAKYGQAVERMMDEKRTYEAAARTQQNK